MKNDALTLLPRIIDIAKSAGALILPFFREQNFTLEKKSDNSPVTNADLAANQYIENELEKISDLPILSEEGSEISWEERRSWSSYWLVDPLDGTRGFVRNNPEFTVNIALIENHQSTLGVIFVPEKNITYFAVKNKMVCKQVGNKDPELIKTRVMKDNVNVLAGQYYNPKRMELLAKFFTNMKVDRVNSSLKFALIAEGSYDFYLRVGPICEWDVGAGQCILEEAGGVVVGFGGEALQYNLRESLDCPPFIAMGDQSAVPRVLEVYNNMRIQNEKKN